MKYGLISDPPPIPNPCSPELAHQLNPHHSGVTFHGEPHMTLGGVGRNLAAAIELLGHEPTFVTSLANDNLGQFARIEMAKSGESLHSGQPSRLQILRASASSSCFALVLIDSISGQCEYVIADLDATKDISRENLESIAFEAEGQTLPERIKQTPLLVLDANLPAETLDYLIKLCADCRVPIFLEPTDVVCLESLVVCLKRIARQQSKALGSLSFLSPNVVELAELVRLFDGTTNGLGMELDADSLSLEEIEVMAQRLMQLHMPHLKCLPVTMDKRGVLVAVRTGANDDLDGVKLIGQQDEMPPDRGSRVRCKHYEPELVIEQPVSASGAGDCFAAGFVSGLLNGKPLSECIQIGFRASACALSDRSTVPITLKHLAVI